MPPRLRVRPVCVAVFSAEGRELVQRGSTAQDGRECVGRHPAHLRRATPRSSHEGGTRARMRKQLQTLTLRPPNAELLARIGRARERVRGSARDETCAGGDEAAYSRPRQGWRGVTQLPQPHTLCHPQLRRQRRSHRRVDAFSRPHRASRQRSLPPPRVASRRARATDEYRYRVLPERGYAITPST